MERARTRRPVAAHRRSRLAVLSILGALAALVGTPIWPAQHVGLVSDVAAGDRPLQCAKRVGGLPFDRAVVLDSSYGPHTVHCEYHKALRSLTVSVIWIAAGDEAATKEYQVEEFCLRDLAYTEKAIGAVHPLRGQKMVQGHWHVGSGQTKSAARAAKAAAKEIVHRVAPQAAACPLLEEEGVPATQTPTPTPTPSTAEDSPSSAADPPAVDPGITETTIILTGSAPDEIPDIGTQMTLPEDDRHHIVIGGPEGEVIREDYIGDRGTITGYGPIVTDVDGNWSVLVTIDASSDREPTLEVAPEPIIEPTPGPAAEPAVVDDTPASVDAPAGPTEAPTVAPSGASEPSSEPIEAPDEVPGLKPEARGAVRLVEDQIEIMGETIEDQGSVMHVILPRDIAPLRALRPDYVRSVTLGSGSIIVKVTFGGVDIDVLVTPIVKDGLIEVRLSRFQFLQSHEVVQRLVRALNAGVARRGGHFEKINVTPEGITLTAKGPKR